MASLAARNRRVPLLLAPVALLVLATTTHAEVVEIAWDASGRFDRVIDLAPAKFAEVCGRLTKGQSITWSFKSSQPSNINIHYREGKNVVFPAKKDRTAALDGELQVGIDQDYCWMWENPGDAGTTLTVALGSR